MKGIEYEIGNLRAKKGLAMEVWRIWVVSDSFNS